MHASLLHAAPERQLESGFHSTRYSQYSNRYLALAQAHRHHPTVLNSTAMESRLRFAFVFPMASGHINPSLPVARGLVKLGHEAGS